MAVEHEIRVICINDRIDTDDADGWEDRLLDAVGQHARANRMTKRRVKRGLEGRFDAGAAVGLKAPGYIRTATTPATEREPARGPFYDAIDPDWAPVIREAFERVVQGQPLWAVAEFLTQSGLPKTDNAQKPEWTAVNVRSMIRNPIYVGTRIYRKTVVKKASDPLRIARRISWSRTLPIFVSCRIISQLLHSSKSLVERGGILVPGARTIRTTGFLANLGDHFLDC